VAVGIREDDGDTRAEGGEARVADYATYNEFGLGVPERSFLRSTVDGNEERYKKFLQRAGVQMLDGEDPVDALDRVGMVVAADVKRAIVELDDPPNAPATIAMKGSANPLIDSGRMVNSISHEVRTDGRNPGSGVS